jgi:hypothetical protein
MHVALAVAFGSIVVAPFIGRWRANVWLKTRIEESRPLPNNVIEIA